jgi:hypothetical protein
MMQPSDELTGEDIDIGIAQFDQARTSIFQRYSHCKDPRAFLKLVLDFTAEGHSNRETRCLSIGICAIPGFVCYNQRTLSQKFGIKKSSIDSLFLKEGYMSTRRRGDFISPLCRALPSLLDFRNWTARKVPVRDDNELHGTPIGPHQPMPVALKANAENGNEPLQWEIGDNYALDRALVMQSPQWQFRDDDSQSLSEIQ